MAHNESFSLHPKLDEGLIRWLNAPSRKGQKSNTIKKALYLFKEIERTTDTANFAQKIEALPEILETVLRIERKLKGANFNAGADGNGDTSQDEADRKMALSMIEQMEQLED
jgi:hypothetical protein